MHWIHLSTTQDVGLEFWQTSSNAIITYQSVTKESVVNVVSESGKRELFARQLTPREQPKVTLRPSWLHTRSKTVSMHQETESNLQVRNSDLREPRLIQMSERGHPTVYRCQSRRHPQRRDLQGRAVHAKNRRTSPKLCDNKRNILRRLTSGQHSQ